MSARVWKAAAIVASGLVGMSLARRRQFRQAGPVHDHEHARRLLERAVAVIRLPTSPEQVPEVLQDGTGLRCPTTGTVYAFRNGVLDLLSAPVALTETQRMLNTPLTSWAYDRSRDAIMRWFGLPSFAVEVGMTQRVLQVRAGDTVLDLACGHGNFTVEWAKRAGTDGFVIGLDISPTMLERAADRVTAWDLSNVLLVHGDAHHLPFVDGSFRQVNCSGGFHQLPDLSQALREIARISADGAILTASTFAEGPADRNALLKRWLRERFALHFLPLSWLGEQLAVVGYQEYTSALPGGWFGYLAARKMSRSDSEA